MPEAQIKQLLIAEDKQALVDYLKSLPNGTGVGVVVAIASANSKRKFLHELATTSLEDGMSAKKVIMRLCNPNF